MPPKNAKRGTKKRSASKRSRVNENVVHSVIPAGDVPAGSVDVVIVGDPEGVSVSAVGSSGDAVGGSGSDGVSSASGGMDEEKVNVVPVPGNASAASVVEGVSVVPIPVAFGSPKKKKSVRPPPPVTSTVVGVPNSEAHATGVIAKAVLVGHVSSNRPNEKGSFISRCFALVKLCSKNDTIPSAFEKFTPVVLKGWGNINHFNTAANSLISLVPFTVYDVQRTNMAKYGAASYANELKYTPTGPSMVIGDGTNFIPSSASMTKDDVFLTGRSMVANLATVEHGRNVWCVGRLGDKDVLLDAAMTNNAVRLFYDDSNTSIQLLIWDDESPLAVADSGSLVIIWAYVNQKANFPKKLSLISGGVLPSTSFEGEAAFMPIDAPPFVPENKFLPCITPFNLMGYFTHWPEVGVRIMHNIPFVLECVEDEQDYVEFLCPTCTKKLSLSAETNVYSCEHHGIISIDRMTLVSHPVCRLSVRLGSAPVPANIFVTKAKIAKDQEMILFGHSCEDICKGASLFEHEGVKFTGTFFIESRGITVDHILRVHD